MSYPTEFIALQNRLAEYQRTLESLYTTAKTVSDKLVDDYAVAKDGTIGQLQRQRDQLAQEVETQTQALRMTVELLKKAKADLSALRQALGQPDDDSIGTSYQAAHAALVSSLESAAASAST